jgi:hypothetical protein
MWDAESLEDFFKEAGVPDHFYSFYAEKDDAICIEKAGNEWVVYYSERGARRELGFGKTESQALDLLRLFVLEEFHFF